MPYLMRLVSETPDAIIAQAISDAVSNATTRFAPLQFENEYPRSGFGITSLTSRAVAATNQSSGLQGGVVASQVWGVSSVTSATWTDWINLAVDDRVYLVITGIFNRTNTPHVTNIRLKANGEDLPWVNLELLYNWDLSQAYFQKPLIISPTNNLTVRVLTDQTISGAAGTPAERIGLLGYQIAKRNYLIAES